MKSYATFFLIAVMSLGLVFLLVTRPHKDHPAPGVDPAFLEVAASPDGGAEGGTTVAAAGDAGAEAAAPLKQVERPLRVTTLGWELVAPGVALTAVDGGVTGPALELAPETTLDAVEARLARGGSDPVGADIAVLPLPAFVVAYDRLRALDPRAFVVVGFSRGREEVHASPGALLKPPPAADEVKLIALAPATAADATAKAAGSESATTLGLFALDLLGVPAARVRMIAPGAPDAKAAPFSAIVRGAADERKLAFSTADASKLVPIVAVAPKAQLDANEAKMREFAKAWLDGLERSRKDASNVARRLANKELVPLGAGVGGAPEAIALLERLGQIEPAGLAQQRALIGATAASAGGVTLDALAQKTWALCRAGGLTTSAAPSPLPIDERVATAIAPAPPPKHTADAPAGADAGAFAPLPTGTTPLLVYRAVDAQADAATVAAQIGFLAGVFEHAAFRVSAKGGEKAARAIAAQARDRFDIAPARLATAAGEPAGAFATVEIVSLP
ncbi:MAG: hypothetical protein JWP87_5511 [Labilithrix sp.]|nr:hypothetical protein [Labilithrix sp.]